MNDPIVEEIQGYLHGKQLENVTKRLLDLAWNSQIQENLYREIRDLRKNYNEQRTLGSKEISPEASSEFLSLGEGLLNRLAEQRDPAEREVAPTPLVEVEELEKQFKHFTKSFSFGPVSLTLHKGEILGVVGENGNGKTTFLRLIQEEIGKNGGSLTHHYKDSSLKVSDAYKRKNRTAFIPQRVPRWWGTLLENLSYFAAIHGYLGKENERIVDYVIHRMGLTTFVGLSWSQLSSGYKLRFELAKMLVWEPDILILDEPLANLDIQATQFLLDDLSSFAKNPRHPLGIVLTSQLLHEVEQIADQVLFLRNGKEVYSGHQADFAASREHFLIEVGAEVSHETLMDILKDHPVEIESGKNLFQLRFPRTLAINKVLGLLISQNIPLTYYRDITNSTIQLFDR